MLKILLGGLNRSPDREDDHPVPRFKPRGGPEAAVVHENPDHFPVEGVQNVLAKGRCEISRGGYITNVIMRLEYIQYPVGDGGEYCFSWEYEAYSFLGVKPLSLRMFPRNMASMSSTVTMASGPSLSDFTASYCRSRMLIL